MNARELIEFITNPYNPSVNPWSYAQNPGNGVMGRSQINYSNASKTTGSNGKFKKTTYTKV